MSPQFCGFVGAIPPRDFLETFMVPDVTLPPAPPVDFSRLYACETNETASETLIRILDDTQLCPGLKFYLPKLKKRQEVALRAETERDMDEDERELHISCHPSVVARKRTPARSRNTRKNLHEYYDFCTTALTVEAAVRRDEDPFVHHETGDIASTSSPPSHPTPAGNASGEGVFDIGTIEAHIVRMRLLTCAQALFLRQHRTRLFQLVLVSEGARFILFDRSGAMVTQRFDYLKTPGTLADFLWRFSHMSDAARGLDSAAAPATRQEAHLLTESLHDFMRVCPLPDDYQERPCGVPNAEQSLDSSSTYPIWTIQVSNSITGTSTKLVAQKPFAGRTSLFGPATRAYLAYDVNERRLVFLKDSWRATNDFTQPEFDIYQTLRSRGFPFVPEVLYGGDVPSPGGQPQRTVVDAIQARKASWRLTAIQLYPKIHHRIVQGILYPLESVSDEQQLIQALHDTIIAIDKTYQTLGLLHRDISSTNVMLDAQGRCVLGDWDRAGPPNPDEGIMGTMPFMSVRLLLDGTVHNELVDDLQSAFWVLNYVAIVRFAQHHNGLAPGLFEGGGSSQRAERGADKLLDMCGAALYEGRYRSAALTALLRDLAESWTLFVQQQINPPAAGTDEDAEPNMLELAPQPKYWLEKFAEALRECDAEKEEARRVVAATAGAVVAEAREPQVMRAGTKRKAVDDAPAEDEYRSVRRSKRLRVQRQRKQ